MANLVTNIVTNLVTHIVTSIRTNRVTNIVTNKVTNIVGNRRIFSRSGAYLAAYNSLIDGTFLLMLYHKMSF